MFDTRACLRNLTTGSLWVSASSLSNVVTLSTPHGHKIEMRAFGRQAQQTLDHIFTLAVRGFDHPPVLAEEPLVIQTNGQRAPMAAFP